MVDYRFRRNDGCFAGMMKGGSRVIPKFRHPVISKFHHHVIPKFHHVIPNLIGNLVALNNGIEQEIPAFAGMTMRVRGKDAWYAFGIILQERNLLLSML